MNVGGAWERMWVGPGNECGWGLGTRLLGFFTSRTFAVLCSRWSTYMYTNLTKVLLLNNCKVHTLGRGGEGGGIVDRSSQDYTTDT